MTIALTGATGFLGRYIANRLAAGRHTIRCWHRPSSDRSGFEPIADRLEWLPGALGDAAAARCLVKGCSAVVHSALDHSGRRFMGGEGELVPFVERNLVGTLELIEAALAARVPRFVFISTCAVHDHILDDRPLDETHPLWPHSHYGAHKAALEKFVHSFGLGHGYAICALRPTGIYGRADPPEESKWFDLVRSIVNSEPVECRRGGKEVHASDVARAVELLLSAPSAAIAGQAFNCCDRYVSEWEVALLAKELSDSRGPVAGGPTEPRHEISTAKLRALGMTFGGRDLLRQTVQQLVDAVRRN